MLHLPQQWLGSQKEDTDVSIIFTQGWLLSCRCFIDYWVPGECDDYNPDLEM